VTRLNAALARALKILLTTLMGLLVVPVVLQIASRFVDALPHFIWTEEVARFCFIWIVLIGAMVAVREDAHFELDLMARPATPRRAAIGRLVVHGAMLAVAGVFIWWGVPFARLGFAQTSELTGLNMAAVYLAWPAAGVIFALFLAEKIAADYARLREGDRGRA